jgi:hypothetical protein
MPSMIAPANPNPERPEDARGHGGELRDDGLTPIKHARLVDRALQRRWNIPIDRMASIAERMADIALQEQPCVAVKASQVLTRMEAQNQADEHRLPPPKPEAGQVMQVVNINLTIDDWRTIRERKLTVQEYLREREQGASN